MSVTMKDPSPLSSPSDGKDAEICSLPIPLILTMLLRFSRGKMAEGYVGSVQVSDGEYLTVISVVTLVVVNKTGRVSDKSVLIAGEIWDRTSTKIHREAGAKCISGFSEFSLKFVIGQSDISRRCESHVATEYVESK